MMTTNAPSSSSRNRLCILMTVFCSVAKAWVPPSRYGTNKRANLTPRSALESLVDPETLQTLQSTVLDSHVHASATVNTAVDTASGLLEQGHTWASSLLTSASTASIQVRDGLSITPNTLRPAHEHADSWFGAADPYLKAGIHSIPPTPKGMENLGVQPTPTSALPPVLQRVVAQDSWNKLLDARTIQQESFLPGFVPTRGILPLHNTAVPPQSPESFVAQVEWSARFLKVTDKLPEAAFVYALVEFFLLRPNIDLYKEEIRQEPGPVAMEAAVTVGVRMAAFAVIAAVTLGIFGG